MKMKMLSLLVFSLFCLNSFAIIDPVVTIINEVGNGRELSIKVSENKDQVIERLLFYREDEKIKEFNFEELLEGEVLLYSVGNRDIIYLECPECTVEDGGVLVMKYLHNAITDDFRYFLAELHNDNGNWKLNNYDSKGKRIKNLRIVGNYKFGILVGIHDIEVE